MIHSITEFEQSWKSESARTLSLMRALTDKSLAQPVAVGHRTLGRIAWHTVTTIPEMLSHTGLVFTSLRADEPMPASAAKIASAYEKVAVELFAVVKKNWTDADLKVTDNLYGETWARGLTLHILIDHEIHHRGQMSVLMRQAGLVVTSIYGPALEEWAAMGMQPPML